MASSCTLRGLRVFVISRRSGFYEIRCSFLSRQLTKSPIHQLTNYCGVMIQVKLLVADNTPSDTVNDTG